MSTKLTDRTEPGTTPVLYGPPRPGPGSDSDCPSVDLPVTPGSWLDPKSHLPSSSDLPSPWSDLVLFTSFYVCSSSLSDVSPRPSLIVVSLRPGSPPFRHPSLVLGDLFLTRAHYERQLEWTNCTWGTRIYPSQQELWTPPHLGSRYPVTTEEETKYQFPFM